MLPSLNNWAFMLWKIENTNFQILGSVHVSDRCLNLSPLAIHAINNATTFAFEANLDFGPNLKIAYYEKTNMLSKNISASLFASTRKLWLQLGLIEGELEGLRPWWVAFRLMNAVMERAGFVAENGIDRRVLDFAKNKRKKLFFLEANDAGLVPFAEAPLIEQERFLSRVLNSEEALREVASIIAAWESCNPVSLLQIVENALQLMPVAYSNALAGRNKAWLPHLVRLAKSQKNVVVVVGVLHMSGPNNIQYLLAKAGFSCVLTEVG